MEFSSIFLLFFYLCQVSTENDDNLLEGTELLMSFMTHRHGDRTPVNNFMFLLDDPEFLGPLIEPHGFGQLTNRGIRRGYEVGKFIRRRYNQLLSTRYNRSEIYIRSTDSTRAKITALSAMAAVYPPVGDTWSEDINWVPVPYTTVPPQFDFNSAVLNCPIFITELRRRVACLESSMGMDKVTDMIANCKPLAYSIFSYYESKMGLVGDAGDEINELMPDIEAAADEAIEIIFGDEDFISLQAGVLLNEFFVAAKTVMAGNETQRIRVYSAHDFNVYSLAAVSRVTPRQGVPKFGAIFALELRKVLETGKYVVLPVYVTSPEEPERYLPVDGCDDILCDVDKFYDLTSKYLLDVDQWRDQCGWTKDFEVDTSNID